MVEDGLNLENLTKYIDLDLHEIKNFNSEFNFENFGDLSNIDLLNDLLLRLDLSLGKLNESTVFKISFNWYYNSKLIRLKNQFESLRYFYIISFRKI